MQKLLKYIDIMWLDNTAENIYRVSQDNSIFTGYSTMVVGKLWEIFIRYSTRRIEANNVDKHDTMIYIMHARE